MKKLLTILFSMASLDAFAITSTNNLQNPEVEQYIQNTSQQTHIPKHELEKILIQANFNKKVIDAMNHPYEEKPWDLYRKFFITPQRINQGVEYYQTHQAVLNTLAKQYGVKPSILVAVVGIETDYGKRKGTFSALDSLYTLGFYYPTRAKFFRYQLTELILLSKQDNMKLSELKSSYAGALGIPQFMPDSYRKYAVDFDHNGKIDLLNSDNDALASIANFLNKKGWKSGANIADQFRANQINPNWISARAIPNRSISDWKKLGVQPESSSLAHDIAALVALNCTNAQKPEYWLIYPNFRVIMSYNPRVAYAMAVFQLSQGIDQAYGKKLAAANSSASTKRAITGSSAAVSTDTPAGTQ